MVYKYGRMFGLIISGLIINTTASAQDDNVANCELVIEKPIVQDDDKAAKIATFLPADDFVYSVFDAEPGYLTEIKGDKIRALMCRRGSVVPTQFDAKLIKTGVPFFLSPNFDAPDSPFLSVRKSETGYRHEYSGTEMSANDQLALEQFMQSLHSE